MEWYEIIGWIIAGAFALGVVLFFYFCGKNPIIKRKP
jgi:hypothetical protein